MLIECPFCHARAQLPESKEGAKVRCGECARVYVARPPGAKGASSSRSSSTTAMAIGGAVAGGLILLLIVNSGGSEPEIVPEPEVKNPVIAAPLTGWRSPQVQAAVALHQAAWQRDEMRLRIGLDAEEIWVRSRLRAGEEATGFASLSREEREAVLDDAVESLTSGADKELVADWEPFDGTLIGEADTECLVHLDVRGRDPAMATANRSVAWSLVLRGERWKAASWERNVRPGEIKRRSGGLRGVEKVTLSDGSVVLERDPEPLGPLPGTPPEVVSRIEKLYATMIDLDLTREGAQAKRDLVAIGKPSIPRLLTGLYQIPLDTEPHAIQINMIVQALRETTAQNFGFKPMVLIGSAVGTTAERRESAIRQWFAWWYRNQNKFEEAVRVDALDALLTE